MYKDEMLDIGKEIKVLKSILERSHNCNFPSYDEEEVGS